MSTPLKIDLVPQEVDLALYSGDGVTFRLLIKDKEGDPVNLTGGTFKAQIRPKLGVYEDDPTEFDIGTDDLATGYVRLTLIGSKVQDLAPNNKFKGFWDIEWTPAEQEPKTLCQGKVTVDLDVTR